MKRGEAMEGGRGGREEEKELGKKGKREEGKARGRKEREEEKEGGKKGKREERGQKQGRGKDEGKEGGKEGGKNINTVPDPVVSLLIIAISMCFILIRTRRK